MNFDSDPPRETPSQSAEYQAEGRLRHRVLDGWWMDAWENPEALLLAILKVARSEGLEI